MKRLRTARLMPRNCARSLSSLLRFPARVSTSFWESIPATCTAGKPKRRQIARWFPFPMCPSVTTPCVQAGCGVTSSFCPKKRAREPLCWIRSRVASSGLATEVAANQLLAVVDLLVQRGLRPVIIGDRWYACAPFLARMAEVAASCLLRVKCNRVFYRPAPPRQPGQRGPSRKDGARFQCSDERTHGDPNASWEGTDQGGRRVEVHCWNQLHLRNARWVEVSVIQVIRHGASERPRDPKMSWFVWKGDEAAPLAEISPTYRLRYSHEHGYRLDKQVLLWDEPRLRTPEQTERWTQIVACAHNQLVLARPLVAGIYRPWETRHSVLTLAQARRAMPTLLTQLGTPARPPQPRGKAPGRAKGFHPKPATRHPVIRKTSKKQKKRKTATST